VEAALVILVLGAGWFLAKHPAAASLRTGAALPANSPSPSAATSVAPRTPAPAPSAPSASTGFPSSTDQQTVSGAAVAPALPTSTAKSHPAAQTEPGKTVLDLDTYLGVVADSATPYAVIQASKFDNPGGVSTKAYIWRVARMIQKPPIAYYGQKPPSGDWGYWSVHMPLIAAGKKTPSEANADKAKIATAQKATISRLKTATNTDFHGGVLVANDQTFWAKEQLQAGDSQQNVQNPTLVAPADGGYATLRNGQKFVGWVRLPLSGANYARMFTWVYYNGFLVPVGAKDVSEQLYENAKSSLGDCIAMASFIAAAFTGGAAMALFMADTFVQDSGVLAGVTDGDAIFSMTLKAASEAS